MTSKLLPLESQKNLILETLIEIDDFFCILYRIFKLYYSTSGWNKQMHIYNTLL